MLKVELVDVIQELMVAHMVAEEDSGYWNERVPWYKVFYRNEILGEPSDGEFEGHILMAPTYPDEYLTTFFGDYMQLPPEEDRVPEHISGFSMTEDYRDWLSKNRPGKG